MTKQQKIENFDPSQPGLADATVFGLPFTAEESEIFNLLLLSHFLKCLIC
jgi:hypothetical protein